MWEELAYSYFLAKKPLAWAWKAMMTTVIFRSLSSSSWASTPVRKKILLCPILYRLGSKSRCLIYTGSKKKKAHTGYDNTWNNVNFIGPLNLCDYHEAAGLFAIHETFGDSVSSQDLITTRQERDRDVKKGLQRYCKLQELVSLLRTDRWRNSWKTILLGNPCRQIRIPSNTPLHLSCSRTRWASSFPAWDIRFLVQIQWILWKKNIYILQTGSWRD